MFIQLNKKYLLKKQIQTRFTVLYAFVILKVIIHFYKKYDIAVKSVLVHFVQRRSEGATVRMYGSVARAQLVSNLRNERSVTAVTGIYGFSEM